MLSVRHVRRVGTWVGVLLLIALAASQTHTALAASLPQGSSLSGFVYFDTDHNGVMDSYDWVITDAQIQLMQSSSGATLATTFSSKDGSFHFDGLSADTYSIQILTPNNNTAQDSGAGQMILDQDGSSIVSVDRPARYR